MVPEPPHCQEVLCVCGGVPCQASKWEVGEGSGSSSPLDIDWLAHGAWTPSFSCLVPPAPHMPACPPAPPASCYPSLSAFQATSSGPPAVLFKTWDQRRWPWPILSIPLMLEPPHHLSPSSCQSSELCNSTKDCLKVIISHCGL